MKRKHKKREEIKDYDEWNTSSMIDPNQPLRFEDLSLRLPDQSPTQVVSIRLPSTLLNKIKVMGSEEDVPYQALIKHFLAEALAKRSKKTA